MRFDLAADPWGTAMVGAALLGLVSLLVLLAASLARTSRRTGARLMLVSLLAFLGAAAGGTWTRIRAGETLTAEAPPAPPASTPAHGGSPTELGAEASGGDAGSADPLGTHGPADEDSSTGGGGPSAGTGAGETSAEDPTEGATGDSAAASTGEPEPAQGDTGDAADVPGEEPPPEPAQADAPEPVASASQPIVAEDLPKVEPLPTEPEAREEAIREILQEAERASGGGERCGNLKRVAEAWARLRQVPVSRKAKKVTADLERCRRRLLYSISQKRLAEMIDAREAWYAKLPGKLRKEHGLAIQSALSGAARQRLRIGNRELDEARADALMDAGLRDELLRLEFAQVVISNGKKSKTYALPVTPDGELGLPWLRAVGLGEPLRLGEPG
jgi:hypothetical protein